MSSSCLNSLISHTRLAGRWWVSRSHQARVVVVRAMGSQEGMQEIRKSVLPHYDVGKTRRHVTKKGFLAPSRNDRHLTHKLS